MPTNESGAKTYVMPKVSVIMKEGSVYNAPLSYSYALSHKKEKRSFLELVTSICIWIIGFFIAVVLFSVPVAMTSYLLVTTMESSSISNMRNQDVPNDGTQDGYHKETTRKLVNPAD